MHHGQQQHDEREERQNGIGGHREGVGVYLGLHQVTQRRHPVVAQSVREAVGLREVAEDLFALVFGQQALSGCPGTERRANASPWWQRS